MTTKDQDALFQGYANQLVESIGDDSVANGQASSVLRNTVTMNAETRGRPPTDEALRKRIHAATAEACALLTERVRWLQKGEHEPGYVPGVRSVRTGREPNSLVLFRRTLHMSAQDGDVSDRSSVRSTAWVGRVLGSKDVGFEKPTSQNVGGRFVQLYVADCVLAMDPQCSVIPEWIVGTEGEVYRFLVEATTRAGWRTEHLTIGECAVIHEALDVLGYPWHPNRPTITANPNAAAPSVSDLAGGV